MMIQFNGLLLFYDVNTSMMIQFNGLLLQSWPKSWRLRTRLGRELSLVCVEASLARNEPSVRGGQSLTKTIGIKVCGSFCHRISVTSFCHRISVTDFFSRIWGMRETNTNSKLELSGIFAATAAVDAPTVTFAVWTRPSSNGRSPATNHGY